MAQVIHNSTTVFSLKAKEHVSNPSREAYQILHLAFTISLSDFGRWLGTLALARLSRDFNR